MWPNRRDKAAKEPKAKQQKFLRKIANRIFFFANFLARGMIFYVIGLFYSLT